MHICAKRNIYEVIAFLLSRLSPIDAQDESGRTPLMIAAKNNYLEFITILLFENANPKIKNEYTNYEEYSKYFNAVDNNKAKVINNGTTNNNIYDIDYLLNNNTVKNPISQPNNNNYNFDIKNRNNRTMTNQIIYRPKIADYDIGKQINNKNQEFINNTNVTNNINVNQNNINDLVNAPVSSPDSANKIYITNYQNNFRPRMASVTKIDEASLNIQNPTPIKRRPLNKSNYQRIILKDIGIINLGNTCFINSCLQVLIHCPSFIYGFFSKDKLINKEQTPISYYLYAICVHMMDTVNTQEKYIDISTFRNKFAQKHQIFGGFIQNDSQEFCRVLLEDLSNELNEVKNKAIYKTLTISNKKTKIEKDEEFYKNFKERENSIIIDLFYAQLITSFTCHCGEETYSFQKILDFPLLLPENVQNIDNTITMAANSLLSTKNESQDTHTIAAIIAQDGSKLSFDIGDILSIADAVSEEMAFSSIKADDSQLEEIENQGTSYSSVLFDNEALNFGSNTFNIYYNNKKRKFCSFYYTPNC